VRSWKASFAKCQAVSSLLTLCVASSAWAADPEFTLPAPALIASVPSDWAGFYAGVYSGAALSTGRAERGDFSGALLELDVSNGLFPSSIDDPQTSLLGGIALGYNLQRGAIVGGLELDITALGQDTTLGYSRVDPNPNPPFTGVNTNTFYTTKIDGLATLRLRGGYIQGRTLFFVSAGLAAAEVENDFRLELPEISYTSPPWSKEDTRFGWALGMGVERKLTDNLSLKAEILHYDLDDARIEATDSTTFPGERIDYRFENAGTMVRVGLTIAF
jgi:outer membrane immunogenic protein